MKFILLNILTVVTIKREDRVESRYLIYVNGHFEVLYFYRGNYYFITKETKDSITLTLAYLYAPDQVKLYIPRDQYEIGVSRYVFNDRCFAVKNDYSLTEVEG